MLNNDQSLFGLSLTQKLKDDLKTASTWAMVSAIVSFVNAAINLFYEISNGALFSAIISAGISVLLNIFLLNFGRKVNAGINEENQDGVNEGLNNLRLYFMVTGIIVLIGMALAILGIVITALAVGTRTF